MCMLRAGHGDWQTGYELEKRSGIFIADVGRVKVGRREEKRDDGDYDGESENDGERDDRDCGADATERR